MPAVFMQVSLKGSYCGAVRIQNAVSIIFSHPLEYLEAWLMSLIFIALSFTLFPLFPWITFWAYLAIGVLFNNVLLFDSDPLVVERMHVFRRKFISAE